jgi:hypothetical protein
MSMKKTGAALAAIMMMATLVACGAEAEPDDGIDTGVVVERSRRVVVVLEDDGERDKHSIHKRSRKCPVGSRWPDCKNSKR